MQGARANKETSPGESMPQTSLCTVIPLAQTELLIPPGLTHDTGILQAGREGQPEALELAGSWAGPWGRAGSVVPILRAASQAGAEREGCLGILGHGGKGIMRDQRATEHHKAAVWLKGQPRADRGKDRQEGEGFLAFPSSQFPRGEREGSWDTQLPLPECKPALHHSSPTAPAHPSPPFPAPRALGKTPGICLDPTLAAPEQGQATASPSSAPHSPPH